MEYVRRDDDEGIPDARRSLLLEEITFAPNYAMDWLARCASNRANGKGLGDILGSAVVASSDALFDDLDLAIETSRSALN